VAFPVDAGVLTARAAVNATLESVSAFDAAPRVAQVKVGGGAEVLVVGEAGLFLSASPSALR